MGEPTWGKGVGQSILPLKLQGSMTTLILTTLRWLTPNQHSIHSDENIRGKGGVEPDIALPVAESTDQVAYEGIQHSLRSDGEWAPDSDPWLVKAAQLAADTVSGPAADVPPEQKEP